MYGSPSQIGKGSRDVGQVSFTRKTGSAELCSDFFDAADDFSLSHGSTVFIEVTDEEREPLGDTCLDEDQSST